MSKLPSPEDTDAAVGERVRALRTERRLSQEALAEKAGIQAVVISRAERGRSLPSVATLLRLAKALDVPLAALVGEENGLPEPTEEAVLERWRTLGAAEKRLLYDLLAFLGRR